jgi:SAM-dependent methyltransferase
MIAARKQLSEKYLSDQGIEIGALHYAMPVAPGVRVRYVDRFPVSGLREQYPNLSEFELVPVDVVDDGERLGCFENGSLDFIIANHMLEHCENPLGTMRRHLRKVRKGGVLYYAIPDRRFSFDVDRKLTSFVHLLIDDNISTRVSRKRHFLEYARNVHKLKDPQEARVGAQQLMDRNFSIHFHVWDEESFARFLRQARIYLGGKFRVEHYGRNDTEVIAILRKT